MEGAPALVVEDGGAVEGPGGGAPAGRRRAGRRRGGWAPPPPRLRGASRPDRGTHSQGIRGDEVAACLMGGLDRPLPLGGIEDGASRSVSLAVVRPGREREMFFRSLSASFFEETRTKSQMPCSSKHTI